MTGPGRSAGGGIRRGSAVAFRHRGFALFWMSRVLGVLAVEMQVTTVGWQVYRLTGSALDLGLVGLAQFAPFAFLFLISGVVADRFPRVRIMAACVTIQTLCAATLLFFTVTGRASFAAIFAVLLVLGVGRAFQVPAQQAIVPLLVPRAHFANAVAWSSSGFLMARIGGPAIAGILIAAGDAAGMDETPVYVLVAALFAVAATLAFAIPAGGQAISSAPVTLDTVLAGLRFIWSRQVILGAIGLDLLAVLFGGATALLPIFARDILGVGAEGFGVLRSAFMLGGFAGALTMTQRPVARRAGPTLLACVAVFGAGVIAFGLSTSYELSVAALLAMGLADAISVFIRNNLVQIITPDEMLGRVSAVVAVFVGASNELGEFESGVTAHWWGTVPAVVVGGAMTVAVTALFAWRLPQLRRVGSLDPAELIRLYRNPDGG